MHRIVEHVCAAHDMTGSLEFSRGYPATVNHPEQAALARRVMVGLVGESNVLVQRPAMTAEDFAFMLQARPGAYVFLGNGGGEHRLNGHGEGPCVLHNPTYDFNDEVLALGAAFWVRLAETCLPVR